MKKPDGHGWIVVYSARVRAHLQTLAARARQRGKRPEFRNALMVIDAKLHQKPVQFGDPNYQLPRANLTVYTRILKPLVVTYAVHQNQRMVFVRAFQPYPADAF